MYSHELPNWPQFAWNSHTISPLLELIHKKQQQLIAQMRSIDFQAREEVVLEAVTEEIIASSRIEGELLDSALVRSSVARHLRVKQPPNSHFSKQIGGIVAMNRDAAQNFAQPLTKERLFYWHTLLFTKEQNRFTRITVGSWRLGPADVVSGPLGDETVHFEAPHADRVESEMERFLNWIDQETGLDPLLKAAIAHLWFVTIHPFDDGNGRIGRAIADLMLARSENSSQRFYSLSMQIEKERKGYYTILEKSQKGPLEITPWIDWFLHCLQRTLETADTSLNRSLHKKKFWKALGGISLNERQCKVINLLLDGFEGNLTSSKWAKLTKCSQDTALRDILDLVTKDVLVKNRDGGRSTSYALCPLIDDFFN